MMNFLFQLTPMVQPEEHIPAQETGAQSNTVSEQTFATEAEASEFFATVRSRFVQVNRWHEWAGAGTAGFVLTDDKGNDVDRGPRPGDHFKIDIPGPAALTGDGFDWVQVEGIDEDHSAASDCMVIRVRPATNPQNENPDVAHFFSADATSNFVIKRMGTTVSAGVHGRNEKPNVEADTVVDKIRNSAVATGAVTAFSKLQWKALVNGLVKK